MDRLLQYPPNQPLVHVDHSHRRVLAAPPKRQVVTRGACVQQQSYYGDEDEFHCSVPVYDINGRKITDLPIAHEIGKDDDLESERENLERLIEERDAQYALVYYAATKSWYAVLELRNKGTYFEEYAIDLEALRDYLINQRDSEGFMIRLSNDESKPSAKPLS